MKKTKFDKTKTDDQSFKLGDQREERIIFAKVRLVQSSNHIETKMTKVEKVHTSPSFSLLKIDKEIYPVEHPDGPDYIMTEKKYDSPEYYMPLAVAYGIIMTYLNIQDHYQTSTNFDISEFFLTAALFGMAIWMVFLMKNKQIFVIELVPKNNGWEAISNSKYHPPIIVNRTKTKNNGYRLGHVFGAFLAGGIMFIVLASNSLDQYRNNFPFINTPSQLLGWFVLAAWGLGLGILHIGLDMTEKEYDTSERSVLVSALQYDPEKEQFTLMDNYRSRYWNPNTRFEMLISTVNLDEENEEDDILDGLEDVLINGPQDQIFTEETAK